MEARGDPDVAEERARALRGDALRRRLPTEATDDHLARVHVAVNAARDSVAVAIVGVGQRVERLDADRLEEAEPDHRGRDANGGEHVLRQIPERGIDEREHRSQQRVRRPVGIGARHLFPSDARRRFTGHAEDGVRLDLIAVAGHLEHAAAFGDARDAHANEGREERLVGRQRRASAAVVGVARATRARVECRPETIARSGARGRGDPVVREEVVADDEVLALAQREARQREGERVARDVVDGAGRSGEASIERRRRLALTTRDAERDEHESEGTFDDDGAHRRARAPRSTASTPRTSVRDHISISTATPRRIAAWFKSSVCACNRSIVFRIAGRPTSSSTSA